MLSNHPSVLGSGGGTAYNIIGGTGLFADGTAAAPSMSFASDTDTGIYRYAANSIGFATGGANRFFMSGSQFGGVTGQNIDMPAAGSIALVAAGTNQNITLTPSGTGVTNLVGNNVSPLLLTKGTGAGGIVFSFNGTAYLSSILTSESSIAANCYMDLGVATGNNTTTQQVLRLIGNGRALIGTTTDSGALLQVGTNTSTSDGGIVFGTNTQLYRSGEGLNLRDTTLAQVGFRLLNNSGGACRVQMDTTYNLTLNSESGSVVLKSANTTALTLDSSQNATFAGKLNFGGTSASFPQLARAGAELTVQLADGSAFGYLKTKLRASNGSAGANFSGVPVSITVVDGVVTAVS